LLLWATIPDDVLSQYLNFSLSLTLGALASCVYFIAHFYKRKKSGELQLPHVIIIFISAAGIIQGIKIISVICEHKIDCIPEAQPEGLFFGGLALFWVSVSETFKKVKG
jgi:hypothetical protein